MKTYTMEFTEEEHRFIEKQLDILSGHNNQAFDRAVMDGQFRIERKDRTDKENAKIKKAYFQYVEEILSAQRLLRELRTKFEEGYCEKVRTT